MEIKRNGGDSPKALRQKLATTLQTLQNKDIANKNDGRIVRLSSTGIGKISSTKAIEKSCNNGFSQKEHFSASADIRNIFENALCVGSFADKNKSPDILAIHRYELDYKVNGRDCKVLLTIKESVNYGNRIYSLELKPPSLPTPTRTK